jgi:hypothetical protein
MSFPRGGCYGERIVATPAVRDALREARHDRSGIGSAWVFPSPSNETKACSRYLLHDRCVGATNSLLRGWLNSGRRAASCLRFSAGSELVARLPAQVGNREERISLGDVAAAGGWGDTETLLRSYEVPDEATIRRRGKQNPLRPNWLQGKLLDPSGRRDLNPGPPAPEAGALTGLRYAPFILPTSLRAHAP